MEKNTIFYVSEQSSFGKLAIFLLLTGAKRRLAQSEAEKIRLGKRDADDDL